MKNLDAVWKSHGLPEKVLIQLNSLINFSEKAYLHDKSGSFEECEVKIQCDENIFTTLSRQHFQLTSSVFEQNIMLSDPEGLIYSLDARLRVRIYEDINTNKGYALVTVKKPIPTNPHTIKKEFEAEVKISLSEGKRILNDFESLGYTKVSSYEKVRHTLANPKVAIEAVVDLLPDIGRYIELEGNESLIHSTLKSLNLSIDQSIQEPYDTIHAELMVSQGQSELDYISFQNLTNIIHHEKNISLNL